MALVEKIDQLNAQIGSAFDQAFSTLRREISDRLRDAHLDLQHQLDQITPPQAGPFVVHADLAPATTAAGAAGRAGAAAALRDAFADLDRARSQAEVLGSLLVAAARFCSRSALLLVRGNSLQGWGAQGFGAAATVKDVRLAPGADSAWLRASGAPDGGAVRLSAADCALLCGPLESPMPAAGMLVPLVLRDRVVAVLYGDDLQDPEHPEHPETTAAEPPPGLAALQSLTYVAALAIETLAFRQRAATATLVSAVPADAPADPAGAAAAAPGGAAPAASLAPDGGRVGSASVSSAHATGVQTTVPAAASIVGAAATWASSAAAEPAAPEAASAGAAGAPSLVATAAPATAAPATPANDAGQPAFATSAPRATPAPPAPPATAAGEPAASSSQSSPASSAPASPADPGGGADSGAGDHQGFAAPSAPRPAGFGQAPQPFGMSPTALYDSPSVPLVQRTAEMPRPWLRPVGPAEDSAPAAAHTPAATSGSDLSALPPLPSFESEPAADTGDSLAAAGPSPQAAAVAPDNATVLLPPVALRDAGAAPWGRRAADANLPPAPAVPSLPSLAGENAAAPEPAAPSAASPVAPVLPGPGSLRAVTPAPPASPALAAGLAPFETSHLPVDQDAAGDGAEGLQAQTPLAPVTPLAPPAGGAGFEPLRGGSLGATNPEVRPPSGVQGPGWAFATGRTTPAVSGGDDALHEEARRLARLLVSEIKLYNEEQVEAGRRNRDIYERLREDIDRSRQMYEERVEPRIVKSTDYFYQELVRILAAGDSKALGI